MALSKTQVSQLYVSIFGRASEGSGNTYWQADASSMTDAANKMLATSAAATYFGTSLNTNQAFIEHIYLNTLGKTYAQDTTGVDYWVGELAAGKSRGEVVAALVEAAQLPVNAGAAQDMFNNKVTVSNYCADNIATAGSDLSAFQSYISSVTSDAATVTAAKATITAANPGSTFTFTASTAGELLVGTAKGDTFIGDKNSIDATDKIIDGSTSDFDTANLSFNAALPTLTIANVENVNVTISNISAVTAVDATNFSGVSNLTVTKSDVVVGTSTLTGNKAVTVSALNAANVAKVTTGAGTTDVAITQATKAGVVVDANTATGNVTVTGATTVTANAMGTGDTLTVNVLADATEDAKAVSVTTTAETISLGAFTGSITVNAASSKNVTLASAAGGATITATGEKGVAGTDGIVVAGIDNSGVSITTSYVGTTTDKGQIAITGTGAATDAATIKANGVTVLTNTNVDELTLSGNTEAVTYEMSSGNATKYTVTGTQDVTIAGSAANLTGKTVAGAKVVSITTGANDLDASKYSTVGKISISANIGANQITVVDGQALEFTSATQTALDIDYATGAKNVSIVVGDVNGTSTAIGTLSVGAFDAAAGATDVGNVTITANESKFTATSTTIGAKQTLVIEGNKDFDLQVVTAKALNATAATGAITAINGASAAAKVVTMNTGSGKDQLTSNTSSVITINSAAGDDTITLTAAAATSEILTGEGADTVNIASATATGAIVVSTEAGDDKVTMDGALDAVLIAGEGTDTLVVSADADETAKTNFAISGFEKIDLTTATTQIDLTLTAAQFANNATVELSGAAGDDIFTVVAAATGSTINASGLTVKSGAAVTVNYTGSAKADTITGGTAAENFTMTAGADSIEGGSGTAVDTFTAAIVADTGTAVAAVINLGSSAVTATEILSKTGFRTAGDAAVAANTAVSLFNDTTSTNVASVTTLGGIESVVGTSAADYIVASSAGTTVSGGTGADYVKGGTGVDTFVFVDGDGITATAEGVGGGTVTVWEAGETITFGNGLDIISGFTAGSGGDIIKGVDAGAPTSAVGVAAGATTGLAAGTTYFMSGAYNSSTGVFTIAADGVGVDTLIIEGAGTALTTNVDMILLLGVDSDNLVAANFIA